MASSILANALKDSEIRRQALEARLHSLGTPPASFQPAQVQPHSPPRPPSLPTAVLDLAQPALPPVSPPAAPTSTPAAASGEREMLGRLLASHQAALGLLNQCMSALSGQAPRPAGPSPRATALASLSSGHLEEVVSMCEAAVARATPAVGRLVARGSAPGSRVEARDSEDAGRDGVHGPLWCRHASAEPIVVPPAGAPRSTAVVLHTGEAEGGLVDALAEGGGGGSGWSMTMPPSVRVIGRTSSPVRKVPVTRRGAKR